MAGAYAGMLLIIAAFSMETRGRISSRSIWYLGSMAFGQILLGLRAYDTGEWPFAILSAIWAGVAFSAILRPISDDVPEGEDV